MVAAQLPTTPKAVAARLPPPLLAPLRLPAAPRSQLQLSEPALLVLLALSVSSPCKSRTFYGLILSLVIGQGMMGARRVGKVTRLPMM